MDIFTPLLTDRYISVKSGALSQFTKNGEVPAMDGVPRRMKESSKKVQIVFDLGELIRYITFREKVHELWKDAC